jgi:cytochrome c-type biogenesis protein
MDFGPGSYAIGLIAGAASVLSPCVLPLLPILIATALSRHRFGTVALAAGLSISFTVLGTLVAAFGALIGLDADTIRRVAAGFMIMCGVIMVWPRLGNVVAAFGSKIGNLGNRGSRAQDSPEDNQLLSQFGIGLLLGLVWSPCVGPTLGAASTLAAQGRDLGQIALLMATFGIGAGLPLLVLGSLSRVSMMRARIPLLTIGKASKLTLGILFTLFGLVVLTGFDRQIETVLLDISPIWLTQLTTAL